MFFWKFSNILRILKVASSRLERNAVDQDQSLICDIRKPYMIKIPPTNLFWFSYPLAKYLFKVKNDVIRARFMDIIQIIHLYC